MRPEGERLEVVIGNGRWSEPRPSGPLGDPALGVSVVGERDGGRLLAVGHGGAQIVLGTMVI